MLFLLLIKSFTIYIYTSILPAIQKKIKKIDFSDQNACDKRRHAIDAFSFSYKSIPFSQW